MTASTNPGQIQVTEGVQRNGATTMTTAVAAMPGSGTDGYVPPGGAARADFRDAMDLAVARDIDLPRDHLALPQRPIDADRLGALVEQWGLASPVARLTGVLASLVVEPPADV